MKPNYKLLSKNDLRGAGSKWSLPHVLLQSVRTRMRACFICSKYPTDCNNVIKPFLKLPFSTLTCWKKWVYLLWASRQNKCLRTRTETENKSFITISRKWVKVPEFLSNYQNTESRWNEINTFANTWSVASVFHQSVFSIVDFSWAKVQMYIEGGNVVDKLILRNSSSQL